jgi:glycosyltransferase involved in cell wall biosynthesis
MMHEDLRGLANSGTFRCRPLVSVVTPVYNGAKYLRECIESVLAQTYQEWEYIIVNNCSSDQSLNIAREYERQDPRIHVYDNTQHLPMLRNFNSALRKISPNAKYCKILHADDWLMPECLDRMVSLAEENPNVAIVGSYRLEEDRVTMVGLPYPSHVVSGKKICRATLLGELDVFGAPSNLLLRSDEVRQRPEFYEPENLHADTEICFEILHSSDFGFVHQVLTFTRRHNEAATMFSRRVNTYIAGAMACLVKHGPFYLNPGDYKRRLQELMADYYRLLAKSLFHRNGKEIWQYHGKELSRIGYPINRYRVARAWLVVTFAYLIHPFRTIRRLVSRVRESSSL